jgi:hypothetical protein
MVKGNAVVAVECDGINLFNRFVDAFGQTDGTYRTDEAAEMTADALRADDMGLTGIAIEGDRLMTAIQTRHIAALTANTLLAINLRRTSCAL